jgi:peptidoglycan/LPS O-acetylase OafA/YrhL
MLSGEPGHLKMPNLGGHLSVLDGIRGVAILAVLVHHFVPELLTSSTGAAERGLERLVSAGWIGVDLFFVLSGFLISGILLDTKGHRRYFLGFYGRRVLRILPVYYLFIALCLTVVPFLLPDAHAERDRMVSDQGWFWGHLVNFYIALVLKDWPPFATGHLWSLAVEEQFYAFWPLVVFLVNRRNLLVVLVGIIVFCPVLRGVMLWTDVVADLRFRDEPGASAINYMLIPFRLDGLAWGSLVAVLARSHGFERLILPARRIVIACGASLAVIFVARRGDFSSHAAVVQVFGYALLAGFFAGGIVLCLTHGKQTLAGVVDSRFLRFFGKYSYGMYVFHMLPTLFFKRTPVPEFLTGMTSNRILAALSYALLLSLVTTLIAVVSFHGMEKRFLALRRFMPRGG